MSQFPTPHERAILLALEIADSTARADIECNCAPMAWEGDIVTHYDGMPDDPEMAPTIAKAREYLTLRGKLKLHPVREDWVCVNEVKS